MHLLVVVLFRSAGPFLYRHSNHSYPSTHFELTTPTIVIFVTQGWSYRALNLQARLARLGAFAYFRILEHFLDYLHENLANAQPRLGGRLNEHHAMLTGPGVGRFLGELAFEVALVADQKFDDGFAAVGRVHVDFLEPLLQIFKSIHPLQVVDENTSVRASVVGRGQGAEALLARRIPNGEFDLLIIDFEVLDLAMIVVKSV